MPLGSSDYVAKREVDVVPSGIPSLDTALGIGGLPFGRIIEIHGWESSGKTTLALQFLAMAQKKGLLPEGLAAIIDSEFALDPEYAKALGVDLDSVIISQPDYGEQAISVAKDILNTGKVKYILFDSITAIVPKAEIDEGADDSSGMASHPRLISKMFRQLTTPIGQSGALAIFTNQMRSKVGVFFGSPDVPTGGNAVKFFPSIRMKLKVTERMPDGNKVKVEIVKNKLASPYKECELMVEFGRGFTGNANILEAGMEFGIIEQSGSHYYLIDGENKTAIGNGKAAAMKRIKEDPEISSMYDKLLRVAEDGE